MNSIIHQNISYKILIKLFIYIFMSVTTVNSCYRILSVIILILFQNISTALKSNESKLLETKHSWTGSNMLIWELHTILSLWWRSLNEHFMCWLLLVSLVPLRLFNPTCGANWRGQNYGSADFIHSVKRMGVKYHRLHPNYFFGVGSAEITVGFMLSFCNMQRILFCSCITSVVLLDRHFLEIFFCRGQPIVL